MKRLHLDNYQDVDKLLADAWLNIQLEDSDVEPQFLDIPDEFLDKPELYITWVMSQPDFFSFTCKELLGIHLLPFQGVVLKELWTRKFPMMGCCRGFSKCETGDSIIMSNNRIGRIKDFVSDKLTPKTPHYENMSLFGENGYKEVEYSFYNGKTDNIVINTNAGFKKECTKNHPVRCVVGENIEWKNSEDINVGDYVVIDRTESWIQDPENKIEPDEAYLLGLIVGDGGYTQRGYIGFTTADKELSDSIKKLSLKYFGKSFVDVKSAPIEFRLHSVELRGRLFSHYGFQSAVCEHKDVPDCILRASKDCAKAFIQ